MIRHYPSTEALRLDYLAEVRRSRSNGADSWYGGETEQETVRLSQEGDTKLVPEAERLLAQLDLAIETPRPTWVRSPAGAFPSVPDVLAGLPTPMRRAVPMPDERAPITIIVTTTSSAGVEASVLRKRGTVVLALVMALARIRPVSLRQLAMLDGNRDRTGETIITSEISTTPLDLASACYILTSAGFARRMTYGLITALNDATGAWPRTYRFGNSEPFFTALVPRLGLDPAKTLVVYSAEYKDPMLADPIGWVQAQITRFTTQDEDQ